MRRKKDVWYNCSAKWACLDDNIFPIMDHCIWLLGLCFMEPKIQTLSGGCKLDYVDIARYCDHSCGNTYSQEYEAWPHLCQMYPHRYFSVREFRFLKEEKAEAITVALPLKVLLSHIRKFFFLKLHIHFPSRTSCIRIGWIFWTRLHRSLLSSVAEKFKGSQECRQKVDIFVKTKEENVSFYLQIDLPKTTQICLDLAPYFDIYGGIACDIRYC